MSFVWWLVDVDSSTATNIPLWWGKLVMEAVHVWEFLHLPLKFLWTYNCTKKMMVANLKIKGGCWTHISPKIYKWTPTVFMRRCSTSLMIREMQIKTMRCQLTPIRITIILNRRKGGKKQKIRSTGKDMEKLKLLCTVGENIKWCSYFRK